MIKSAQSVQQTHNLSEESAFPAIKFAILLASSLRCCDKFDRTNILQILAHKNGLPWDRPIRLGDLQKELGRTLEDMVKLVEETLHTEAYTKEEVARQLNTCVERLEEVSFTPNTKNIERFKLRQRALHVFKGKHF